MKCLVFFVFYSDVLLGNKYVWSKFKNRILNRKSKESEYSKNHDLEKHEFDYGRLKEENLSEESGSEQCFSDDLVFDYVEKYEYNTYFKQMKDNIDNNFVNRERLDLSCYENCVLYKIRMLKKLKLKIDKENFKDNGEYNNFFESFEYETADFEFPIKQRINFICLLTEALEREVIFKAPEIVGMAIKFIESVHRLTNQEFISLLLKFDLFINLLQKKPKSQIYKKFCNSLLLQDFECESMFIYKLSCELYQNIYKEETKYFDDIKIIRSKLFKLDEDLRGGFEAILFISLPKYTVEIYTEFEKEAEEPVNLKEDFSTEIVTQCVKLLIDYIDPVFGLKYIEIF